jgi:hypothetical protein
MKYCYIIKKGALFLLLKGNKKEYTRDRREANEFNRREVSEIAGEGESIWFERSIDQLGPNPKRCMAQAE